MDSLVLTGKTSSHTAKLGEHRVHSTIVEPFKRLQESASKSGFCLSIASGFRSYDRQLTLWNEKAVGQRALLDDQGNPLQFKNLKTEEVLRAILRWSAIPGLSRHHWGTEIDVFDANALPKGYRLQLSPEEVGSNGMFWPLHQWLDTHMAKEGFFRPYETDKGGVSPERWHLSHGPTAQPLFEAFSIELFKNVVQGSDMALKDLVLDQAETIFERYFRQIDLPVEVT